MRFRDSSAHLVGRKIARDLDDARAFLECLAHHAAPGVGTIDLRRIIGAMAGDHGPLGRVGSCPRDDPTRREYTRRRDHVGRAPLAETERLVADPVEVAHGSEAVCAEIPEITLPAQLPYPSAALIVPPR